jgi:predicted aminopeptidase
MSYLYHQAIGQMHISFGGDSNHEVIKSGKLTPKKIEKIHLIEKYKKHFNKQLKSDFTKVYSKTVLLKGHAVSYLVYASPRNEIKAKRFSFPFFGSFPYIGFFDSRDAKDFSEDLEEQDYVTYTRPVYAYSTLGWFNDPILSSFFYYDRYELAELIFHEMTHLYFFIKDEISLNENLAQFIGRKMSEEYFVGDSGYKKHLADRQKGQQLIQEIVQLVSQLQTQYKKTPKGLERQTFETFMAKVFRPTLEKKCRELKIVKCKMAQQKWNNARFVEFTTYEKSQNLFKKLYQVKSFTPKSFMDYLKKEYDNYDQDKF